MAKYCENQHRIARQLEIRAKKQLCRCQSQFGAGALTFQKLRPLCQFAFQLAGVAFTLAINRRARAAIMDRGEENRLTLAFGERYNVLSAFFRERNYFSGT